MKIKTLVMKKLNKGIRNVIIVTVLLSNIGCDQITKNIAREHIASNERISISSYLTLTKVQNSGAFLSLGDDLPNIFRILLLIIIPMIFLIGTLFFILKKRDLTLNYALPIAFIIGGGFGNLYDRIYHGSVTDFLHMNFQIFQTGIFNTADVSIMAGVFWLLLVQLNEEKKQQMKST